MDKFKEFKNYVFKYQLGNTLENVSFKCLTSLKIGGSCKILYIPSDIEALMIVYKYLQKENIPYFIIGAGTNLLVDDKNFDIVVITLKNLNKWKVEKETENELYIYVEAGLKAPTIAKEALKLKAKGAEFLSVIPGTIGGVLYMNAGAYKRTISDILYSVTYIDESQNLKTIVNEKDKLKYRYRFSFFQKKNYIIVSAILKLKKTTSIVFSENLILKYALAKKKTQQITGFNAGSTFKNTKNEKAWCIIEKLGYRGKNIGDAKVSEKHANFIVNEGCATFKEMETLIKQIQKDAKEKLKINLVCEWVILK